MIESEEILGIGINYDFYAKREMEQYHAWMPFTYEIASEVFKFLNDNFYFETNKPDIFVYIGTDISRCGAIELSVRIKDTGWGEAELFTMDIYSGMYGSMGSSMRGFAKNFMERFQKNLIRTAVMEKIHFYRNPPKPAINWNLINLANMSGLMMARCAMALGICFCVVASGIVYACLS